MTKAGTSKAAAAQRRSLFVDAYLANGENGTDAAIKAGFARKSAGVTASQLLKDPNVSSEIAKRREALAERFKINSEAVLRSLAQAVHFDPRKLYREDGSLKAVHELDEDTAMALSGFEVSEIGSGDSVIGHTKKVKWLDKNTAREQAMKHLGLYEKDNRQSQPIIVFQAEDAGVL